MQKYLLRSVTYLIAPDCVLLASFTTFVSPFTRWSAYVVYVWQELSVHADLSLTVRHIPVLS